MMRDQMPDLLVRLSPARFHAAGRCANARLKLGAAHYTARRFRGEHSRAAERLKARHLFLGSIKL